ncbi:MAG: ATP-binding protein [Candidatus Izemoplasmatales bacterium]|nr:ATP-binding protein [Candidatus Izemoplasmatales bacterium]
MIMPNNQESVERSLTKKFKGPIYSQFLKAITDFKLISDGDRIAVALSGGKDSLVLAKLFQEFKRHGQVQFELLFVTMDPGFKELYLAHHLENCHNLGVDVIVQKSNIFNVAELLAKESPCFLCARMRRGFLYKVAQEHGCNKLALGHHFDDVIETTLLNIFYAGCYKTMLPKVRAANYEGMEMIRPMYYVKENDITRFMNYNHLTTYDCGCRISDGIVDSKRKEIKKLISQLRKNDINIDINIFRSAQNVNLKAILGYHDDEKTTSFLDEY